MQQRRLGRTEASGRVAQFRLPVGSPVSSRGLVVVEQGTARRQPPTTRSSSEHNASSPQNLANRRFAVFSAFGFPAARAQGAKVAKPKTRTSRTGSGPIAELESRLRQRRLTYYNQLASCRRSRASLHMLAPTGMEWSGHGSSPCPETSSWKTMSLGLGGVSRKRRMSRSRRSAPGLLDRTTDPDDLQPHRRAEDMVHGIHSVVEAEQSDRCRFVEVLIQRGSITIRVCTRAVARRWWIVCDERGKGFVRRSAKADVEGRDGANNVLRRRPGTRRGRCRRGHNMTRPLEQIVEKGDGWGLNDCGSLR